MRWRGWYCEPEFSAAFAFDRPRLGYRGRRWNGSSGCSRSDRRSRSGSRLRCASWRGRWRRRRCFRSRFVGGRRSRRNGRGGYSCRDGRDRWGSSRCRCGRMSWRRGCGCGGRIRWWQLRRLGRLRARHGNGAQRQRGQDREPGGGRSHCGGPVNELTVIAIPSSNEVVGVHPSCSLARPMSNTMPGTSVARSSAYCG